MLIATLPAIHRNSLLEEIISNPLVDEVRYNAGLSSICTAKDTLSRILELTEEYKKKLWVDLKGRQLRIIQWSDPLYGEIILNHEIEVDCPARIYFRGNEWSNIKVVRGNTIYVDPPPLHAVGKGQAVNIHGDNLKIKGYLMEQDKEYILASKELGLNNYMLSFVECMGDVIDVLTLNQQSNIILKIESIHGLEFINSLPDNVFDIYTIMAARDDLMINIGKNKSNMLQALKNIITKDSDAIVASRIFSGLEHGGNISMADISDIRLMQLMGYKNFMLSDNICERNFTKAIYAWRDFQEVFGDE